MSESNLTQEKGRCVKLEKELDEVKKENQRWESKIADLDADLNVSYSEKHKQLGWVLFFFPLKPLW